MKKEVIWIIIDCNGFVPVWHSKYFQRQCITDFVNDYNTTVQIPLDRPFLQWNDLKKLGFKCQKATLQYEKQT